MTKRHFSIKSVLFLMLVMLTCALLLAGCAKEESIPDITYNDIVEANRSSVLLESYTSVKALTTDGGDSPETVRFYVDSNIYAADYGDYQLVYTPEIQGTLEKGAFNPVLNLSGEEFYLEQRDYFMLTPSELETVSACVRTGDTLIVTTALSEEESKPAIEAMLGKAEENDYLSSEYCIDADNYSLQSYSLYLCRQGEERQKLDAIDKIVYDEEAPAFVADALELATAPAELAADDMRTISVIMNPGTSDEETFSVNVAKGAGINIIHREGYSTFYLDAACTVPYAKALTDKNADLTLYGIPDK